MNGLITITITWAGFLLLNKVLQRYSQRNQGSFSIRRRRIVNTSLITLAIVITIIEVIHPFMEAILQPPDISPYNYEEVYEPPVEIEMRIHGIFPSMQLPFLDIYYTTDGSDPSDSESAIKYDGPFNIDESTSFSARCRILWFFWGDLLSPSPYYQIAPKAEEFIAVEGIKVEGPSSMYVGESKILSAIILPENATDKKVNWVSSNPDIATVDTKSGTVHAVAASKGPIEITAKTNSGQFSATIKLTIHENKTEPKDPTGVTSSPNITKPSDVTSPSNTTKPSDTTNSSGSEKPSDIIDTPESNPPEVPVGPLDDIFEWPDFFPPNFPEKELNSIEIIPNMISIKEGEHDYLQLISDPADIDIDYIEWESQDISIAWVTDSGKIIGVNAGTTYVTATVEGCRAIAYVEVQPDVIEVTEVCVSPKYITLQAYGDSEYVDAWVLPTNATDQRLRWRSENENIVRVTSNGLLIPGTPGITTVHVTDWAGQYGYPIEVEVISPQPPIIDSPIQPSMSVSTNPSVVSVDGFVDISFDFTTPNRYTEVWIVHTIDPDKTNFIRLVDGPLFTYNEYVEGYRSLCICPRDYGLLPGSYSFYVYLCEQDEYGNPIVLASDTFNIVVY